MAHSFVGKPISLISHSDVRYRGLLAGVDTQNSTIQLSNVYSLGTENRRPPHEYIPPVQDPYEYIIFRASEVKDLALDDVPAAAAPAPPVRNVHDDPAVLGASRPAPAAAAAATAAAAQQPPPQRRTQSGNVTSAAASLETVERAIGDLRVSDSAPSTNATAQSSIQRRHQNQSQNLNRSRQSATQAAEPISVPNTDFDFQSSNARFNKDAGKPKQQRVDESDSSSDEDEEGEVGEDGQPKQRKASPDAKKEDDPAYNPQKSFFDTLSPGPQPPRGRGGPSGSGSFRGQGGGGRGRGGYGRNRREEEREKNVATFGEPGGVGLLGPGAYVGGWGGYGRRGGGAGRRGGRGGAAAAQPNGAARA